MLALVRAYGMARPFYGALWLLFALVLFIADEHGVLGTYGSGAIFSSAGTRVHDKILRFQIFNL